MTTLKGKCIIFDMDGVLIDSEPVHKQVEKEYFRQLGIDIPEQKHDSFTGTSSLTMWKIFKSDYGIGKEASVMAEETRDMYMSCLKDKNMAKPVPGIIAALEKLNEAGAEMTVASSSPLEQIDFVLEKLGISGYFPVRTSGDEVENGKPAPDIFILAAERIGLETEDCVIIEDSRNGITAAAAAGIKSIGYKEPVLSQQDLSGADTVIDSMKLLTPELIADLLKN